ncbi:MAG: adenine-specific DNA-methyltransferase [Defluviitaleaceae bacterium]|nr:adenine-specific DNA-methyltransferase [Defluviitaleaceae bacterium]
MTIFETTHFETLENADSQAVLGDCLVVLKQIKTDSVDLIFADPPYGIGKDFGTTKDNFFNADDYKKWAVFWIDECMRVLKPNGTMYFMSATQHMPMLDNYVASRYFVVNRIVWIYDSSGVQSKSKFGSLYEPILMVTQNEQAKYTFNYKNIMIETNTGARRKLIDYRKTPPQPYNNLKVPGNVWNFSRVRYKMAEYENHPTQKPEALLERIILASSNEGDIVLDPFSGSFTTSAVAVRLKRKAVGIEINPDYFKIGLRRTGICDVYKGEPLFCDKSRKTNNKSKSDHSKNAQLALTLETAKNPRIKGGVLA